MASVDKVKDAATGVVEKIPTVLTKFGIRPSEVIIPYRYNKKGFTIIKRVKTTALKTMEELNHAFSEIKKRAILSRRLE